MSPPGVQVHAGCLPARLEPGAGARRPEARHEGTPVIAWPTPGGSGWDGAGETFAGHLPGWGRHPGGTSPARG